VYGYKQSFGRLPYTGRPNAFNSIFPFLFENFKKQGLDLLKDHSDDFTPQYLEWIERVYEMVAPD
jgi:hypothetical protein